MSDSAKSSLRRFKRIVLNKQLPDFLYRMDDRRPVLVRQYGLQPKGQRTDGADGQFGPVNQDVTVFEHVRKTFDGFGGVSPTNVDPWISFFAWHALQPVTMAVIRFMQGYQNGFVYMIDTQTAIAGGCEFCYANEEFDLARRTDAAEYRGQREWSCKGTAPARSVRFVIELAALTASLVNNSAPDPTTLPWVGLAQFPASHS